MGIAVWRLPVKQRSLIILFGLLAIGLFLFYLPLQRFKLISQIERGIADQAWPQVTLDLRRLWEELEGTSRIEPWFEQALRDLTRIHSIHIDSAAQLKLVHWLVTRGAPGAARALLGQNYIVVDAGSFTMGSETGAKDERPEKQVSLSGFAIDRFEVTHLQYREFLVHENIAPPRYWIEDMYPEGMALHPVVGVSWDQAQKFCAWTGKRLPTEAEWERTCRGDENALYPWGDKWNESNANLGLSWSQTWPTAFDDAWRLLGAEQVDGLMPIGSYPQAISPYGGYDLIGNAAEWVFDWYNWTGYASLDDHDPVNLQPPWNHVVRGNGWFSRQGWADLTAEASRCSARSSSHSYDDPRIGFRCALNGWSSTAGPQ